MGLKNISTTHSARMLAAIAGMSFTSAVIIIFRNNIVNYTAQLHSPIITQAQAVLTAEQIQHLLKLFEVESAIKLPLHLTSNQVQALEMLLKNNQGITALQMLLMDNKLRKIIPGLLSLDVKQAEILKQILTSQHLTTILGIVNNSEKIKALTKLLNNTKYWDKLLEILSMKQGAIKTAIEGIKNNGLQEVLQTLLISGDSLNTSAFYAFNALKEIPLKELGPMLNNAEVVKALQTSMADPNSILPLLEARLSAAQPLVHTTSYVPLGIGIMVFASIAFAALTIILIMKSRENTQEKINHIEGRSLGDGVRVIPGWREQQNPYLVASIGTASLLGASLVITTALVAFKFDVTKEWLFRYASSESWIVGATTIGAVVVAMACLGLIIQLYHCLGGKNPSGSLTKASSEETVVTQVM